MWIVLSEESFAYKLAVAFKSCGSLKFDIYKWYLSFFCYEIQSNMDLCHMNSGVSCEIYLLFVGFTAFVARERPLPRVRPHVLLQITRLNASIIALVALEWLFSCVIHHHVGFQLTSSNAGKLACCASVRLFSRVGSFVVLQSAWLDCSIVALIAFMWLLPRVRPHVLLQVTIWSASEVALVTLERLFSCVHPHHVLFQLTSEKIS